MIKFARRGEIVIIEYTTDVNPDWVETKLKEDGFFKLSKTFFFERRDIIGESDDETSGDDEFDAPMFSEYEFRLGRIDDGYLVIEGRILDIDNRVLIAEGYRLSRKTFSAYRDISIFPRIARLLPAGQDIVIGGDREDAIPVQVFDELIAKFPGSTELDKYVRARISDIVGDYFDGMEDARQNYEEYLNKRRSTVPERPLPTTELLEIELAKYELIRDTIADWLADPRLRSEEDWQRLISTFLLLIFPKYVAILQKVRIADQYSTPGTMRHRQIDIALVDDTGNIDVIEIKRPTARGLLSRARYRDNGIPNRELTGTIMQAEKYIFHLSKWGLSGERELTRRHAADLPANMQVKITNPKAIVILGRDKDMAGDSLLGGSLALDFEVIRRKYSHMMDIMTYDDLLRRLDNVIASLRKRIDDEIDI